MSTEVQARVRITVELDPEEAAALARLCEKFHHFHADQFLYPHVDEAIRRLQRDHMLGATCVVEKALLKVGVRGWPWVESGQANP